MLIMNNLSGFGARRASASVWDPSALFASSEQGAWYDPSDLTTMFQDRFGATSVTADGQTVGLILDKSKGLVLGSEIITPAANRDFSSDTGWWTKDTTATISGGVVNVNTATDVYPIYKFNTVQIGYYEFTYTLTVTSGSIKSIVGQGTGPARTVSGTYTDRLYSPAISTLGFRTFGAFVGTIDNVSLKPVTGNHATAPSDAARPLYKTSGGLHWLQFDGVDDSLLTSSIDKSAWAGGIAVYGYNQTAYSSGALSGVSDAAAPANEEPYSDNGWYFSFGGTSRLDNVTTLALNTKFVLTRVRTATATSGRKNGSNVGSPLTSTTNFGGTSTINLAQNSQGSIFTACKIYSMIIRAALSTTQEITDTETWVNSKTGAY